MAKRNKLALGCIGTAIICALILQFTLFVIANDPFQLNCLNSYNNIYFELPSNAQQVERYSREGGRSCSVLMKFTLAPSDLDSFLATTFIRLPLSSTQRPENIGGIYYMELTLGTSLETVQSFLAGESEYRYGEVNKTGITYLDRQNIFVDTSNPSRYVIYLTTMRNWF